MGIIDIIIVVALLPAIWFGLKEGFVKQLVSIIVIVAGIWASLHFSDTVATWLIDRFAIARDTSEFWLKTASFIIIFIAVAVLLNLLGKLIEKVLKITMMGWVNRLLGLVFCVVKFAFIIALVIYFVNSLNDILGFIPKEKIDESTLYKPFLNFISDVFPHIRQLFAKS